MTQEEILDYNKRCAEFLNWKFENGYYNPDMHHDYSFIGEYDLKFDSDWNWIMEVVQKIENIESFLKVETREEFRNFQRVLSLPIYTKLEAVVLAIWQFLNWYKQNKL